MVAWWCHSSWLQTARQKPASLPLSDISVDITAWFSTEAQLSPWSLKPHSFSIRLHFLFLFVGATGICCIAWAAVWLFPNSPLCFWLPVWSEALCAAGFGTVGSCSWLAEPQTSTCCPGSSKVLPPILCFQRNTSNSRTPASFLASH